MSSAVPMPYKTTPVFDEVTLPAAIRSAHSTKAGVWGLLRVFDGEATLVFHEPYREVRATFEEPAAIPPEAVHNVRLDGPVRLQVEFYREQPSRT